jgi:hypothetical protein
MYGLLPKELLKGFDFRWVFRNLSNAQSPMKITFRRKTVFLVLRFLTIPFLCGTNEIERPLSLKEQIEIQFNESNWF